MAELRPFRIEVLDAALEDLHRRLDHARWPDSLNDRQWSYGTEAGYLRELTNYWRYEFNWRSQEAELNRFKQFLVKIDQLETHFIHQTSPHPEATPICISHGWPGSVVEFLEVIDALTHPEQHGGTAADAFHVVCPSLPGYGYSSAATEPGMNSGAIARRHCRLMSMLGYDRYIAQGGDWGALISRHMAVQDSGCIGLHLNMAIAYPPGDIEDPLSLASEPEKAAWARSERFNREGMGYFHIQSTRPQTLAYGLNDSPLGLCAWLTEKFRDWSDCDGEIRNAISWDRLLTNVALYWFSNSIGSSTRLYYEEVHNPSELPFVKVPTGVSVFPAELVQPPKAWVEKSYHLVYHQSLDRGGHFAAMEQPQLFVEELRRFKASLES